MKVHGLDIHVVNLGLGGAQRLENVDRRLLRLSADCRILNNPFNLRQAAAVVVFMFMWRGRPRPRNCRISTGGTGVSRLQSGGDARLSTYMRLHTVMMLMLVRMRVAVRCLVCPEFFSRQLFLAVNEDVDLGRRNSTAVHLRDFQPRSDVERGDGLIQQLQRHARIDQGAQKHVAAHAGEAV